MLPSSLQPAFSVASALFLLPFLLAGGMACANGPARVVLRVERLLFG